MNFGCLAIELMVTGHNEHRCQRVHEIHSLHHLLAIPQLAFKRWEKEFAAAQAFSSSAINATDARFFKVGIITCSRDVLS